MPFDFFGIWLPLIVAALIQASFALGVSMLALLSGHLLSNKKSAKLLGKLSFFYILGSSIATASGVLIAVYFFSFFSFIEESYLWSILSGSATGIGLMVLFFYYRHGRKNGTRLWLPRRAAEYLYKRIRATQYSFETFILGIAAIILELVFIAVPMLIAANLIANLSGLEQVIAIKAYILISILPLLILAFSNLHRRKISEFQKWREKNKKFLQVFAGISLIVLGIYLFIYKTTGV